MQEKGSAGTVLVVDDDKVVLSLITSLLEAAGYEVMQAWDGLEGWEVLSDAWRELDAILLDRNMPGMDGLELLGKIKSDQEMALLPVVMVTAAVEKHEIAEGILAGAYYYLTKPFDNRALVTIVRTAVNDFRDLSGLRGEVGRFRKMLELVRKSSFEFKTISDARDLAILLADFFPEPERVVLGLSELLVNSVEHGNLGMHYELKGELISENCWLEEIERLQARLEHAEKKVTVHYERSDSEISVRIRDEGEGFDWRSYLELDPARVTDNHGRGIAMARMMSFDAIEYLDNGNEVLCRVFLSTDRAES
ncbi:response regulator [Gemmatimonadota bacterium]